ncbi:STAS domain-containing protein [Streptomyces cyaneofuscatus]|uniref:STAS domain-containing protein n=1 Tax=Streptomyces TaxID=1883 RepID=UPI00364DA3E4
MPSVQPPPSEDRAVRIITRQERGALVLTVSGDLDIDSVPPLGRALEAAAEDGSGPVVVDLSGVGFADSTTVNVLLQGQTALGGRLRLAAPSPFVRRLIGMIGLDSAIPVRQDVDEAIDAALPS